MSDARPVPAVDLDRVGVVFGEAVAVDEVTLSVQVGEVLCLLGPSGSGKSTLLRVVAGLTRPTRGRVSLTGTVVDAPAVHVRCERRHVGMVFQDYALFPHLTVAANVAFGLRGHSRSEVRARVGALLERVGLSRFAESYPHTLSGGERQRVALVRALAPSPAVLLLDEPFSGLDGRLREQVRRDTMALVAETGTTAIVVTHDPEEGIGLSDRIALLRAGRLEQCGTPDDLYHRPVSTWAARFFSHVNEFTAVCRQGAAETPVGTFAAPHVPDGARVRVCIRPQHVRLSSDPQAVAARVLTSAFLGEVDAVALEIPGVVGPVAMRVFGRAGVRPGETVHLDVDRSHAVVMTDDGSSVSQSFATV